MKQLRIQNTMTVRLLYLILMVFSLLISNASGLNLTLPQNGSSHPFVTVFNVGQGNCTYVNCDSHGVVVDCGREGSLKPGYLNVDVVSTYIKKQAEIKSSFYMFITHFDADHYSYLDRLLVDIVLTGNNKRLGLFAAGAGVKLTLDDVLTKVANPGDHLFYKLTELKGRLDGPVLECTSGYSFYILAANSNPNEGNKNDNGLVVMLTNKEDALIFTGDAQAHTLKYLKTDNYAGELLAASNAKMNANFSYKRKRTRVIFAAHHGADTQKSHQTGWMTDIRPTLGVYQAGNSSQYRHPRCTTIQEYKDTVFFKQGPKIGKIRCGIDNDLTGAAGKGWDKENIAGRNLINLYQSNSLVFFLNSVDDSLDQKCLKLGSQGDYYSNEITSCKNFNE